MAVPSGLEPETVCLEGRCSIQLSYGTSCGRFRTAKFGREVRILEGGQGEVFREACG